MTGKELIVYILENNLENESVFKDGKFIGFLTAEETALMTGYGVESIYVLIQLGQLEYVEIGEYIFIPEKSVEKLINSK